jgi:glycerol transport system permease protein
MRKNWMRIGMVMAMTCLSLVPGVAMIWLVRNHLARGFALRA